MEHAYAQALWQTVEKGEDPKKAVASLLEVLKKHGRSELMPRIFGAFKRLSEQEANKKRNRVWIANEKDAAPAMKASGVNEADVCVDETLIGGWRLEQQETLVDVSFKKMLLDMYNRSIAS